MDKQSRKALMEQYKNRNVTGGVYCVRCRIADDVWLRSTVDMQGSKNRFNFSQLNDSYPEPCMREAWKRYGASSFSFEVLEEIKMGETQTDKEFADDVAVLLELWAEKQREGKLFET